MLKKKRIHRHILDTGLNNFFFLYLSPQARATKPNIMKWNYIKLKKKKDLDQPMYRASLDTDMNKLT